MGDYLARLFEETWEKYITRCDGGSVLILSCTISVANKKNVFCEFSGLKTRIGKTIMGKTISKIIS